jgi:tRNA(fMet)-specific endonuclease VapC
MNDSLLDTDMLSDVIKGLDPNVVTASECYLREHPFFTFTSVSVYEILYGLGVKQAHRQIEKFLKLVEAHQELVPTPKDYRLAADIRACLHRAGTPIGTADPVIAACAVNRAVPLVTGNSRHYEYIADAGFALILDNWRLAKSA